MNRSSELGKSDTPSVKSVINRIRTHSDGLSEEPNPFYISRPFSSAVEYTFQMSTVKPFINRITQPLF